MEAHYLIRIVFWNISVVYKTKENFIYVTFLFIVILVIFKLFELCGFCRATTRASKKKKTRARFALHKTFTNKLQPRLPKKKRAHTVSARDRGPRILVKSIPLRKSFFWMHKKNWNSVRIGRNVPESFWYTSRKVWPLSIIKLWFIHGFWKNIADQNLTLYFPTSQYGLEKWKMCRYFYLELRNWVFSARLPTPRFLVIPVSLSKVKT